MEVRIPNEKSNEKPILKVTNLNITYDDKKDPIVEDGDFVVYPGEIVLILGENGSGKSSVFKSLVGDIDLHPLKSLFSKIKNCFYEWFKKNKQKTAHISLDMEFEGKLIDSSRTTLSEFREKISYVRQIDEVDSFFQKKVWAHAKDYVSQSYFYVTSKYVGREKNEKIEKDVQSVYDALECVKYANGKFKDIRIKHLSGGERRMASILSAFSRKHSRLFILDEPVNNLDGYHSRVLNNYLVNLKQTENPPGILIITHCPMFTKVDRVYHLKNGKLIEQDIKDYKFQTCFGSVDETGKYFL